MKKIHQWIQIRHYCEGSWHPYVVQSYCVYPCISKWHFRHHVLRRTSQTSVVMAEIKQHLSQNSLWLPHILTSGIGIRAKERKKVNICNELQLFLKQAQKRLIYLKYLKSLAWWFNYLWKPGHNLEWERLSRYWNEMQMFFFFPFLCLYARAHLKIDYESAPSLSVTEREFKLCVHPLSCICLFKFKFSTLLSACLSAFLF